MQHARRVSYFFYRGIYRQGPCNMKLEVRKKGLVASKMSTPFLRCPQFIRHSGAYCDYQCEFCLIVQFIQCECTLAVLAARASA